MQKRSWMRWGNVLVGIGLVALILGIASFAALSCINGTRMGIRSSAASIQNMIAASLSHQTALADNQGEYTNIFFLHHSVGQHLIDEGHVRQLFREAGYNLWDQGYNQEEGQRSPSGERLSHIYYVPHDNTDPNGLEIIFNQPLFDLPLNTFSGLMQHEVIIVKSCFPNSQITSDEELEQYKTWYRNIRASFDQHPEKLFIVVTQPPLNPAVTSPEAAQRARQLADWLTSDEFLAGHDNLAAFDLFDLLAESNPNSPKFNMLRVDYRPTEGNDSHPTKPANELIGPLFVEAVIQTIESYRQR
jgi:hypothetical protein